MSSILDALRKLEAPDALAGRRPIRLEHRPHGRPWWLLGLVLAFGAGAGVALRFWPASVPDPETAPPATVAVAEPTPPPVQEAPKPPVVPVPPTPQVAPPPAPPAPETAKVLPPAAPTPPL